MDEEAFIQENISSLLSDRRIKATLEGIGGGWRLEEIFYIHAMPRNIEFGLFLVNGEARAVKVLAKINRATMKFSNIEVREEAN